MVVTRKRAAVEAPDTTEQREGNKGRAQQSKRQHTTTAKAPAPPRAHRHSSGTSKETPATAAKGKGRAQQSKTQRTTTAKAPAKAAAAKGKGKAAAASAEPATAGGSSAASEAPISINRAPVLTLWAAVVAQRQGLGWEEALTFGKQVSGILAQSKGRSLGIYEERERSEEEREAREAEDAAAGVQRVEVFGMRLKAVTNEQGQRLAYSGGKPVQPGGVQGYLKRAFGDRLEDAKTAMEALAAAVPANELGRVCYSLYERFRPEWRGWGVAGHLDPAAVRQLADTWRQQA